jgi:hypothetical protein
MQIAQHNLSLLTKYIFTTKSSYIFHTSGCSFKKYKYRERCQFTTSRFIFWLSEHVGYSTILSKVSAFKVYTNLSPVDFWVYKIQFTANQYKRIYSVYDERKLGGETWGTETLGRPRRRWKDDIKMGFKKWNGGMDWNDLATERNRLQALVNVVMNLRGP